MPTGLRPARRTEITGNARGEIQPPGQNDFNDAVAALQRDTGLGKRVPYTDAQIAESLRMDYQDLRTNPNYELLRALNVANKTLVGSDRVPVPIQAYYSVPDEIRRGTEVPGFQGIYGRAGTIPEGIRHLPANVIGNPREYRSEIKELVGADGNVAALNS